MAAEEKCGGRKKKKKSRQTHRGSRRDGMPQLVNIGLASQTGIYNISYVQIIFTDGTIN